MDTYDQLRACVEEIGTFELKEMSGMFCEYLCDALNSKGLSLSGGKFECILEEPYCAKYFWDYGDFSIDVVIAAGGERSYWSVMTMKNGKKCWMKGRLDDMGSDTQKLVKEIMEPLEGFEPPTC